VAALDGALVAAAVGVQVPTPGILITTQMWITWTELAIEHEHESVKARRQFLAAHAAQDGVSQSAALGRETADGLIAICSAAFAMDALVVAWARLVMDSATVTKWESASGTRPTATRRTSEVLKRSVNSAAVAQSLTDKWDDIFTLRNDAVHFAETPATPVLHPSGISNVAPVNATYGPEKAAEAVDLLLKTLDEVESARNPKLRRWIDDAGPTLTLIRTMR